MEINNKFALKPLALAMLVGSGGVMAQATVTPDADAERTARASIEVITVTGEKTERSLKDTAASVAVINQQMLDSGQIVSMSDALKDVANVVVLTGAVPDIRGVSGNGSATGFNSFTGGARARVSNLVDGVAQPFVAEVTGDTGLWDIEQVEVFRGPQSTSNGRNSIGGAVIVRTRDPVMQTEGAVRLGYRNQDNFLDSALAFSTPIVEDELAVRLATQWINGDTYSNPVVYASNPTNTDFAALETQNSRAKLLWTPKANTDLKLLYSYSHFQEEGNAGRLFFDAKNPQDYIPLFQRDMKTEADTHSLQLDYQLAPSMAMETLVAYLDHQWGFDGYEADASDESDVRMHQKEWTVDSKVSVGDSKHSHSGFVGVAYFSREQEFNSQGLTQYFGDDSSDSKAIYGEGNYRFSAAWNLSGGARVERESQQRDFSLFSRGKWNRAQLDNDKTFTLPKLVLQYHPAEHTTLSVSARQGYNAGGGALNNMTNEYYYYDSEKVNTFELSSRSVLGSGDISLSANLFWNDFSDYQALSSTRTITNIDQAHSYGLELEAYSMLGDDLQLHAAVGLLQSEIDRAPVSFASAIGNELNSAPSTSASLGLSWWLSEAWQLDINTNYIGEFYGDLNNTPERTAGDYVLTRLSAGYYQDSWQLNLFINNAFDEYGVTSRDPVSAAYVNGYVAMVTPRTVGAAFTYRY